MPAFAQIAGARKVFSDAFNAERDGHIAMTDLQRRQLSALQMRVQAKDATGAGVGVLPAPRSWCWLAGFAHSMHGCPGPGSIRLWYGVLFDVNHDNPDPRAMGQRTGVNVL